MKRLLAVLVLVGASVKAQTITQTFGTGANQFSIDFVEIGNPGNAMDDTGFGSVAYTYNLGKYEISREQIEKANAAGILGITLQDMTNSGGNGANRPAAGISWFEAARFVNYLNTSQGKQAAYLFDGSGKFQVWSSVRAIGDNLYRHKDAFYFLPSVDEWYKGAYGSSNGAWYNFPNGSDNAPSAASGGITSNTAVYSQGSAGPADVNDAGGLSAYGTMAQGGNVWEWNESAYDLSNNSSTENRMMRGGSWGDLESGWFNLQATRSVYNDPTSEYANFGFRVAMIPEPSSLLLLLVGGAVVLSRRRKC